MLSLTTEEALKNAWEKHTFVALWIPNDGKKCAHELVNRLSSWESSCFALSVFEIQLFFSVSLLEDVDAYVLLTVEY